MLEPLLPDRTPRRGGRWSDHRLIVDAIRWRVRTGCTWRDLPERFGPWQTTYSRHRRWSADGTWKAVLDHLRLEAEPTPPPWMPCRSDGWQPPTCQQATPMALVPAAVGRER